MSYFEFDNQRPFRARLQKITMAALFAALTVLLSPLSFPVGPSRCFPFQHAVNGAAGVILGPYWACGAAFMTSLIRHTIGTGTLLAFPGSMFGALAVGFAARLLPLKHRYWAALAEPIGTATLGAWTASFIASTSDGRGAMFATLSAAFLVSSVPGSVIGCVALRLLRTTAGLAHSPSKGTRP